MMLLSILALVFLMYNGASTSEATNEVEINTANWDKNPLESSVDAIVIDQIINAKMKKVVSVQNINQKLKVNIYSGVFQMIQELVHSKKNSAVRCSEIIFSWMPLATKFGGEVTMMLIDTRHSGGARIKGQVTFKPERPVVAIFYQNYYVDLQDIDKLDFEINVNGINVQKGNFGQVSLYWKTVVGPPMIYKEKNPVVFYIPIETLPELEVRSSDDIFKHFAQKAKNKRMKEIEYFKNMQNFIDRTIKPMNFVDADINEVVDTINRRKQITEQYIGQLQKYQPKSDQLDNLKNTLVLLKARQELLEGELKDNLEAASKQDTDLVKKYINMAEPKPEVFDY
ncbi:movement protein [Japanese star anise ringspot-associated virus]|uniref:Movement protein n=1 Tax=Japanese star anise ringspot-associated virus TaxID=2798807 RepID=A0A8J9R3E9_9VIRU|nr:movement protein [Japanese star anise ringspot-associated virus]BCO17111.1 movement protein [Japanese star anise ringspot-associated virus]